MTPRDRMIRAYDRALRSNYYRQYFDNSGFYNFGYWARSAQSQREASENLVDELIGRIAISGGRILDVACGPGGTVRQLMCHYEPDMITAVNISEGEITEARKRAPDCTFCLMDATRLGFPENQFDAIICVEAAFHFDSRDAFLREALRILKPGGSLVLSDMLFREFMRPIAEFGQVPRANFVRDASEFRTRLEVAGFETIAVEDGTQSCLGGFRRHLRRWPTAEYLAGRINLHQSVGLSVMSWAAAAYFGAVCKTYLLASARKPRIAQ